MTHPDVREMGLSNIRERHRQESLELLTSSAPLGVVLESVAKAVESELAGSKCSILLMDEANEHLLHGAAPSLPNFYNQAIHGVKIGQGVGSCGTAAFTRQMVIVEDIMTHPYWADFQELAQKAEVGSCWSDPILAADGAVLGTFAIYHQEPRKPSKEDIEQLRSATNFVRLDIEHHRALDNLKKSQERLALVMRGANDGIWDWDIAAGQTHLSDRCLVLLGYQPGDSLPPDAMLKSHVHPDELPLVREALRRHLKNRTPYDVEHRLRTKGGEYRWFRSRGQAVWDQSGRATRMAGTITDVTERRQAEEEVRRLNSDLEQRVAQRPTALAKANQELQVHHVELKMQNEELQHTRDALEASLERYTDLYDFAPVGYLTLNDQGIITETNLTGATLLGIDRSKLLGRRLEMIIAPESRSTLKEFLGALFQGAEKKTCEVKCVRDATCPQYLHMEGAATESERDGHRQCRLAVVDITERKQIEDAQLFLARSGGSASGEDFFRALARYLAQSMGMDFVCIDRLHGDRLTAQTVAVYFDGKFEDNVSYALQDTPCGDVVGKTICCFPQQVRHLFPKDVVLQEMLAESYVGTTLWGADGQPIGLIAVIGRQPLANPQLAESILSLVSVRAAGELERKEFEQTLLHSEERFRALFEQAAVGVAEVDTLSGRFLRVNDKHCKIMGYSREQLLASTFMEVTHPDDLQANLDNKQLLIEGKIEEYSMEKRYIRGDGSVVWINLTVAPLWKKGEPPSRHIAVVEDITDRKQAEEELVKAKEQAEAANVAKSQFLANMSHEIRTPMNAIIGMTDLVLETDLTVTQREYLEIAKSSSHALVSLINDILDLAKIEAGKVELEQASFRLRSSLEAVFSTLSQHSRKKGLDLICLVRPEVPDALVGDIGRLRQVLLNLIGNSIKFTEEGEIQVQVGLADRKDKEVVLQVAVTDTGIGIPPEKAREVFEPFAQADASITRKFGGTGLGLTISRQLVEMMGGEMWLDSAPGQGCTFVFTARLGLDQGESDQEASRSKMDHPPMPKGKAGPAEGLRILLAEDNLVNQKLAAILLQKRGHQVTVAQNGKEALEVLGRDRFDLVLMDVEMPEMDGVEATSHIRKLEQDQGGRIPIIALTAHALKGDRERLLAAGMDDYLTKPIEPTKLNEVLRSWGKAGVQGAATLEVKT